MNDPTCLKCQGRQVHGMEQVGGCQELAECRVGSNEDEHEVTFWAHGNVLEASSADGCKTS